MFIISTFYQVNLFHRRLVKLQDYQFNKSLFHNNFLVDCVSLSDACRGLLDFIKHESQPVLLVGHNIENFDIPVLYNSLCKVNMTEAYKSFDLGCIDTLRIARFAYPKSEVQNHKQETLVSKLLGETYEAHNAIEDVKSLQKLYIKFFQSVVQSNPFDFVFPIDSPLLKQSLKPLVDQKVITASLKTKLGRIGIGSTSAEISTSA